MINRLPVPIRAQSITRQLVAETSMSETLMEGKKLIVPCKGNKVKVGGKCLKKSDHKVVKMKKKAKISNKKNKRGRELSVKKYNKRKAQGKVRTKKGKAMN